MVPGRSSGPPHSEALGPPVASTGSTVGGCLGAPADLPLLGLGAMSYVSTTQIHVHGQFANSHHDK